MSRSKSSKEVIHSNSNEGTAARTRPVSVEEILSRRKALKTDDKEGAKEIRKTFEKDDSGVLSERDFTRKKDTKVAAESGKRLDKAVSKKGKDHSESKDKEKHDSINKTEIRLNYRNNNQVKEISRGKASSRDKEIKNEKQYHKIRGRNHSAPEKESEKKKVKHSKDKSEYEDRERKSGRDGKRKHESHVDDKIKSIFDSSLSKRHDSGKSHDAEYSGRRDRRRESKIHHEEPKTKRRRSRSREYDRERDRSASISPRSYRPANHGRDYDEPIFQSSNEKSRRKYSETDKHRSSGNGGYSGGNYRKHGSGLGGYSPRKRKTEAPVKVPSPTNRSHEKKSSTWDQPPIGTSNVISGPLPVSLQSSSNMMPEPASTVVTPTTVKSHPLPSLDARLFMLNGSVDSVQLTQATRPMRRLYIENLSQSASEKLLTDSLNDLLLSSGANHIQGAKPCISCIINKEKCQAAVEFLTPEDATSAITFDGRYLLGSVIKIRRPKDYVEAATGAPEKIEPTIKTVSEVVKDSPHKIFIGGISLALSSEMLLEIVCSFGVLRAYHFEFNEELKASCAFLEYEDHSITHKACAGLNGMKLGGNVLTAVPAFLDKHAEDDAENLPCYDIPSHAKSLLAEATQVLQLRNVLNLEEFLSSSESELDEILEDIRLECARFGTVKSMKLVRFSVKKEGASEGPDQEQPPVDAAKIESEANSPSCNSKNEDASLPSSDNATEILLSGILIVTADENSAEDSERKESTSPRPEDGHSSQLEVPSGLEGAACAEENIVSESGVGSEIPSQEVDITMDPTDNSEAHTDSGNIKQVSVDPTSPDVAAADEGIVSNGDDEHETHDAEEFEPGSVLIEFLRKEAACAAAHCLHRRHYGEHVVSACYVSIHLYKKVFPR